MSAPTTRSEDGTSGSGYRARRRTPPGTAPGTLVSDPALPAARVRVIRYDAKNYSDDEIDAGALRPPPPPAKA
jgi:hypothetical protein